MRCLQCGKDLPLLKRMAGSEFCSDAHRREYQKEYSDLALGRLLQSKPPGLENSAGFTGAPSPLVQPAATNGHSAPPPSVTVPAAPKPEPLVAVSKSAPPSMAGSTAESTRSASPTGAKKTEARPAITLPPAPPPPTKKAEADPAIAKVARVDKPAPANVPLLIPRTLAFAEARSQKPSAPLHRASVVGAALLEASAIPLGRGIEVAVVSMHAIERHVELRECARPVPRVDLALRVVGPEALDTQQQSLAIPVMSSIAPEGTALWTAEHREFAGSLLALGSLADFGLSPTGFEEPNAEATAPVPVEAAPTEIPAEKAAIGTPPSVTPAVSTLLLERLPVSVQGIAAGRA